MNKITIPISLYQAKTLVDDLYITKHPTTIKTLLDAGILDSDGCWVAGIEDKQFNDGSMVSELSDYIDEKWN